MSDHYDTLISDAFADFDAGERSVHAPVPGAPAVRQAVAHRRKVRLTAFSVIGAMLIAVPIAAFAASPRGNNSPPDAAGSKTPSPAFSMDRLRNATLTLPAFPGAEDECKAKGTRKFVKGKVTTAPGVQLVIGTMSPIVADLDGQPGDELITTIRCQNEESLYVTQLLALKTSPDGALTAMGYVINSADTPNMTMKFSHQYITVDRGVVRVTVDGPYQSDGWPPCDRQVRGYAFQNGAFRQVSGPTTFRVPSSKLREVDFRNTGFLMSREESNGDGQLYCTPMANGVAEVDLFNNGDEKQGTTRYTATIGAVSFVKAAGGEAAFAIVTLRSPTGELSQTLQSFQADGDYPLGWEVLRSGTKGIISIDKAEVSGKTVQVTVTTDSGVQVWSYRPTWDGEPWTRVRS